MIVFAFEPAAPSLPSVPSVPCLAFVKLISLVKVTSPEAPLADTAVITNEPLSCPIEVTETVLELIEELTDVVDVELIVYAAVVFVVPVNTDTSVEPPVNEIILPFGWDANV